MDRSERKRRGREIEGSKGKKDVGVEVMRCFW